MAVCTALFSRVSSLIFELELEDHPSSTSADFCTSAERQLAKLRGTSSKQQQELLDAVAAASGACSLNSHGEFDLRQLARGLKHQGYYVWLRTSNSSADGIRLRHSFLVCSQTDESGHPQLWVIDPHFRDQFLVASPSEAYSALCSYLPNIYVGTASDLATIIDLMSKEVSTMFALQAHACPPWREKRAMMNKWLPTAVIDEALDQDQDQEEEDGQVAQ